MSELVCNGVSRRQPPRRHHSDRTELNNNKRNHHHKQLLRPNSTPSAPDVFGDSHSSSASDISEDGDLSSLLQDVAVSVQPSSGQPVTGSSSTEANILDKRRVRSMSDGCNGLNPDGEPFEVFPSLPDKVLEKLGLGAKLSTKERLNDDELEQKFVSLSLAFTIDAATIRDRSERQRRCRDQTEANLNAEIERLIEKAQRLQPLCVDAETTELLTTLLAHVDVIVRAVDHAATAAERYGAVQHEERLADSVKLMINHVHTLKQQRDSARRQLQYTKRVLQDTSTPEAPSKLRLGHLNQARLVTRRRASIATISQPISDVQGATSVDCRKITRRTSELAIRGSIGPGSVLSRSIRSARFELGLDLVKIRENTIENHHLVTQAVTEEPEETEIQESAVLLKSPSRKSSADDTAFCGTEDSVEPYEHVETFHLSQRKLDPLQIRYKLAHSVRKVSRNLENAVNSWIEDGVENNLFYACAIICFTLSVISLGNILVELEYERRNSLLHSISSWFLQN